MKAGWMPEQGGSVSGNVNWFMLSDTYQKTRVAERGDRV
jgi:hypothetical protein